MSIKSLKALAYPLWPIAANLAIVFACYIVCDVVYYLYNHASLQPLDTGDLMCIGNGFARFSISAIFYTNLLWIAVHLLQPGYRRWHRCLFVAVNSLCCAINLADATYFPFTGRRTTCTVFQEFAAESNLTTVVFHQMFVSWYLVLLWGALTYLLYRAYRPMDKWRWTAIPALVVVAPFAVFGMRGTIGNRLNPISVSDAGQHVSNAKHTVLVLNTPFALIRSVGKTTYKDPHYMSDGEMDDLFSPIREIKGDSLRRRNVVVLIMESFGKEYLEQGHMPFLDSLSRHALMFGNAFANGRKSVDAIPSVLGSIPSFVEPFILTPYSENDYKGLAAYLSEEGYATAFYHGAPTGSMRFNSMTRKSGITDYYGMEDYQQASGRDDYDGTWAIWDDKFMQYFADGIGRMSQPFFAGILTASSHHPYRVPDYFEEEAYRQNKDISRASGEQLPIHKSIHYSDNALRQFFAKASTSPWFSNTLFVIVADHTSLTCTPEYQTTLGTFRIPIIFYAPGDESLVGLNTDAVAQQTDITPTVLSYLGMNIKYLGWGIDLLTTPPEQTWAVNYWSGLYQYVGPDTLVQFDGQRVLATYLWRTDTLLQHPLATAPAHSEQRLKAMIQSYMQRMVTNSLNPDR